MSEEPDERLVIWSGWLKRGETAGTVVGFLEDVWKWRVEITGTLQEGGGYKLEGRLGKPPECLRVPIVDDPVTDKG